MTYSPAWSQMLVKKERWSEGYKAMVRPGQNVSPDQPVLQLEVAEQPTRKMLSMSTTVDMVKHENNVRRVAMILSGLSGHVVEITHRDGVLIESHAIVIQGVIGAGCQVAGVLTFWQPNAVQHIPSGAILVVPGPLDLTLLHQAINSGVAGIIASSIFAHDLEGFLHADLIQLIDRSDAEQAQQHLPAITVLLTEGLGSFAMSTPMIDVLNQYQGAMVLLSGATSIRQGIFPELVISLPTQEAEQQLIQRDPVLTIGSRVRVCCGERTGAIGIIDYFFVQQQVLPSGVKARALRLLLEDGSALVVPSTMVSRIG